MRILLLIGCVLFSFCAGAQNDSLWYPGYASAIRRADTAFVQQQYEAAKNAYELARAMRPGDKYAIERIKECDLLIHEADMVAPEYNYSRYIASGDSCFSLSDFRIAKEYYRRASNIRPMEQYPKDQIRLIDGMVICGDHFFAQAVMAGDSLFLAGDYAGAKIRYQEALALRTTETYPRDQIAKCDARDPDLQNTIRYNSAIADGDRCFARKDWHAASIHYHAASVYKPAEQYPKDKMAECEIQLNDPVTRYYDHFIHAGDSLFKLGQYAEAKREYSDALRVRPSEMYPKDRIASCDDNIRGIQQRKEYDRLIREADSLFAAGNYKQAKTMYQRATYSPCANTWPQFRISQCDELLKED